MTRGWQEAHDSQRRGVSVVSAAGEEEANATAEDAVDLSEKSGWAIAVPHLEASHLYHSCTMLPMHMA